jgi:hypothetical protein
MVDKVDFDKQQLAVLVDNMSIVMPNFDRIQEEKVLMEVEHLYQL